MLRFNPDRPVEIERDGGVEMENGGLKLEQPLVLVQYSDDVPPKRRHVKFVTLTRRTIVVKAWTAEGNPEIVKLNLASRGEAWELYPATNDIVFADGDVVAFAGVDHERPDALKLFVQTPKGRITVLTNPDADYPEIYLDYRAASVGTSAPDRQVAVLQFDEDAENGFKLLVYGDDETDDCTEVITGTQLPAETEKEGN